MCRVTRAAVRNSSFYKGFRSFDLPNASELIKEELTGSSQIRQDKHARRVRCRRFDRSRSGKGIRGGRRGLLSTRSSLRRSENLNFAARGTRQLRSNFEGPWGWHATRWSEIFSRDASVLVNAPRHRFLRWSAINNQFFWPGTAPFCRNVRK